MEQLDKKYKCYNCPGCNRLENENFKGVYRCENFILVIREEEEKNE